MNRLAAMSMEDSSPYTATQHSFGQTSVTIRAIKKRDYYGTNVDLTGHSSWFAATLFSQFACGEQRAVALFGGGRSILELGAGAGLAGCALAKCLQLLNQPSGAIVLTDGEEQVVDLLRSNVEQNNLSESVSCQQLWWGPSPALNELKQRTPEGFSVIFGCDLLYNQLQLKCGTVASLFLVVDELLSRTGRFYLSFTRRDLDVAAVLEAGRARGLVAELQEDFVYDLFGSNTEGVTDLWRDAVYSFRREREEREEREEKNEK